MNTHFRYEAIRFFRDVRRQRQPERRGHALFGPGAVGAGVQVLQDFVV